ncbi:MAG: hypothetical protein ACYCOU_01990 [Sulfobacillus sp.]
MNRMKPWRTKKMSQEAGRLTQICVWAPEYDEERVRQICNRVAEPTSRGQELRGVLSRQLELRRTTYATWRGFAWRAEIDYPCVGLWWCMKNIGGRVTGPDATHIELTPEEALDIQGRLNRSCERVLKAWIKTNKLHGCVRDHTGVDTYQYIPRDPSRPADAEFAANEAKIARSVVQDAIQSRKPPFNDPSIVEYEGHSGFPSFCQIAHRRQGDRVQFALIHMANEGTSPTNMFEILATHMRQCFYPDVDASQIDWFDVFPPGVYWSFLIVSAVSMQQANGIYSKPSWTGIDHDAWADWVAFIRDTIARGQKAHDLAKSSPHDEHTR